MQIPERRCVLKSRKGEKHAAFVGNVCTTFHKHFWPSHISNSPRRRCVWKSREECADMSPTRGFCTDSDSRRKHRTCECQGSTPFQETHHNNASRPQDATFKHQTACRHSHNQHVLPLCCEAVAKPKAWFPQVEAQSIHVKAGRCKITPPLERSNCSSSSGSRQP